MATREHEPEQPAGRGSDGRRDPQRAGRPVEGVERPPAPERRDEPYGDGYSAGVVGVHNNVTSKAQHTSMLAAKGQATCTHRHLECLRVAK